ncbi:uncharacterized protein LOC129222510 [Uloborus diversus]|uniref:uncharacterized protein LOC129222510 n=1 Tax=Uloborus diversus TaxID=327109 RepID=UPI0024094D02|nr:uncharacterized protein LOC129222510 [Uloborus diversus]
MIMAEVCQAFFNGVFSGDYLVHINKSIRFFMMIIIWLICSLLCSQQIFCDEQRGEKEGYYAFEEAPSRFMRPPQVRKPPYMISSGPCPTGEGPHSKKPSPKYTLCGDLNKGFIPQNPLGQDFNGEPYPFELIKNKTLHFLSKALPFLKKDPKIPKVAKISSSKHPQPTSLLNGHDYRRQSIGYRIRRDAELEKQAANLPPDSMNDIADVVDNETTARQTCDQGGAAGLLCSLSSVMSNNKIPLALMNAVAQGLAASMSSSAPSYQEATTPAPEQYYSSDHSDSTSTGASPTMTEAVLNLLGTLANMGLAAHGPGSVKDSSTNNEEPSTLAHVLSVLTGATPGSSSALSLVLKLMASEASPLKALTGGFPARRRRPVGEEIAAESNVRRPQDNDFDLPPTPCPSSEEYVTPTFARNYQGVWKYVVQIPQEGYFTQTVQQTKCMRGRCDFMDGICHESPRWVSLLVAETYYPDTFFPTTSTPIPPPPPVEDFYNFQQYLKRRVGEVDEEDTTYRARPVYKDKKTKTHQHCDGVDHVGCYVVRLYYDWFLVNGSCKCWKPSPKRIFSGK